MDGRRTVDHANYRYLDVQQVHQQVATFVHEARPRVRVQRRIFCDVTLRAESVAGTREDHNTIVSIMSHIEECLAQLRLNTALKGSPLQRSTVAMHAHRQYRVAALDENVGEAVSILLEVAHRSTASSETNSARVTQRPQVRGRHPTQGRGEAGRYR